MGMIGRWEHCLSLAPWDSMLMCQGNRDDLAVDIILLGGALLFKVMLSYSELEKRRLQDLKLSDLQKHRYRKEWKSSGWARRTGRKSQL